MSKPRGGFVIGADIKKGRYYTVDDDTPLLLIGITRVGKSRRIFMPTIWDLAQAGESMIITDLKKELYPATKEFLKRLGYKINVIDLRHPTTGNQWNIMHPVIVALAEDDIGEAVKHADEIAHILSFEPGYRGDPVWPRAKKALLTALILIVATEAPSGGKHMANVFQLLATLGRGEGEALDEYVASLPAEHPCQIPYSIYALSRERMRSSIATDTLTSLAIFASDPAIRWMISDQDHSMDKFGLEKTATFIVIPDETSSRNHLGSLYYNQAYSVNINVANRYGGRLPIRVNNLCDEFGNMPSFPDFATKITTSAGRGWRYLIGVQSLNQLKKNYPEDDETIASQCWTWLYLLTADETTAKIISEKTGKYTVATESYSSTSQRHSTSTGVSSGLTGRPLLMPDEVKRFPEDQVLVFRNRQFPAKLPLPDISVWPIAHEFNLERSEMEEIPKPPDVILWSPGYI